MSRLELINQKLKKSPKACAEKMAVTSRPPDPEKRAHIVSTVKEGSIVPWGQFNFYGEYVHIPFIPPPHSTDSATLEK